MSGDAENQSEAELVRRYRRAIRDRIREYPGQPAEPEGGSIFLDDVRPRLAPPPALGRSPRARWPVVAEPRQTGVELQWHDVVPPTHHTLLRITPTSQALYESDPRFQNFDDWGRRYATLGAGPDPMSFFGMFIDGELKSDYNRSGDVVRHGPGLRIRPLDGMTEDEFINILFKIDREYADDLPYSVIARDAQRWAKAARGIARVKANTTSPGAFDSNSYVSGLLDAAGVGAPEVPVWAPGYDTPVPRRYFGR